MTHKSHFDPAKEKWREAWYQFIRKHRHYLHGKPKDWQVIFFPGEEALEIELYDRLRIPRENLLGLEINPKVWEKLLKKQLGIRLTGEPMDALNFFQQTDEKFDIGLLDYEGTFGTKVVKTLEYIAGRQRLNEESLFGITFFGKRENVKGKKIFYSSLIGGEIEKALVNLILGNDEKRVWDTFANPNLDQEGALSELGYDSKQQIKDQGITTLFMRLFYQGVQNIELNNIFKRNPNFSSIEKNLRGYAWAQSPEMKDPVNLHKTANAEMLHITNFAGHLLKNGFGYNMQGAMKMACFALSYAMKPYFTKEILRYKYISANGSPMLSDFIYFSQFRDLLEPFRYVAEHAYIDLNVKDFVRLLVGRVPISTKEFISLHRKINDILPIERRVSQDNLPLRIFLGSSAKLPELTGEEYYRQRYEDDEKGITLQETRDKLQREFKIKKRGQLKAFEAHYTMQTHGPKYIQKGQPQIEVENKDLSLERMVIYNPFELIPLQYWNRLPDNFKKRVKYFIEEGIQNASLGQNQIREILGEVRASKWYKLLNGHELSDTQFYAFFDDIMLEILNERLPDRKKVVKLLEDILQPNWKEITRIRIKPMLTLQQYEQLSFYEGKSDDYILHRFTTRKPKSLSAYKAWITMKNGPKVEKEGIGHKAAQMIKQGKPKADIMEKLGIHDYQYRGFLAAFKRGAYNNLLQEQKKTPTRNFYVDTHGVVHFNPRNTSDIEKGYK